LASNKLSADGEVWSRKGDYLERATIVLRIQRHAVGEMVILILSGRIEAQHIPELQALIDAESEGISLDLGEVNLVDLEAVRFLRRSEAKGIRIDRWPAYVREWILRDKSDG
jgi:hypothetical protein